MIKPAISRFFLKIILIFLTAFLFFPNSFAFQNKQLKRTVNNYVNRAVQRIQIATQIEKAAFSATGAVLFSLFISYFIRPKKVKQPEKTKKEEEQSNLIDLNVQENHALKNDEKIKASIKEEQNSLDQIVDIQDPTESVMKETEQKQQAEPKNIVDIKTQEKIGNESQACIDLLHAIIFELSKSEYEFYLQKNKNSIDIYGEKKNGQKNNSIKLHTLHGSIPRLKLLGLIRRTCDDNIKKDTKHTVEINEQVAQLEFLECCLQLKLGDKKNNDVEISKEKISIKKGTSDDTSFQYYIDQRITDITAQEILVSRGLPALESKKKK